MIYTLNDIKNKLNKKNLPEDVSRIYLFGSYAKNKATERSDLDFYVEYDHVCNSGCYAIYDTFEDLFNKKIDVLVKSDLDINKYLKKNIYKERILVYDREESI